MREPHRIIAGTSVVDGLGAGRILQLEEPLSFWGGVDPQTGLVVQPDHPQCGVCLAGSVMVMQKAKGSSSSSSVLAELIRNGKGPAAILMRQPDLIVALGAIVADELYGIHVPVAALDEAGWRELRAAASQSPASVECRDSHATVLLTGYTA